MAKIQTFTAKQASGGGGGVVQMQAQQRAMTKAFRKSTNIRAADIYDQSGDQAIAGALGNMATMFNKVAVQKAEADYTRRNTQMRKELNAWTNEMQKHGMNADSNTRDYLQSIQPTLTASDNKRTQERLERDFAMMSMDVANKATVISGKESRALYDADVNEVSSSLMNSNLSVEEKISELRKMLTGGVDANLISESTARNTLAKKSQEFETENVTRMILESSTIDQLVSNEKYISASSQIPITQRIALSVKNESKIESIKANNFSERYKLLDEHKAAVRAGSEITPEMQEALKDLPRLYAERELQGLEDALDTKTFRDELYSASSSEEGQKIFESHYGKKGVGTSAQDSMSRIFNGWKSGLSEGYNRSLELQAKALVSKYDSIIANNFKADPMDTAHFLLKDLPLDLQKKVKEELMQTAKEWDTDYASALFRRAEWGKELYNARVSGDLSKQRDIISKNIRPFQSLVDDNEMKHLHREIDPTNPESYIKEFARMSAIYEERLPDAMFDIEQRTADGLAPKGFNENHLANLMVGSEMFLRGDNKMFSRLVKSLNNKNRPESDKNAWTKLRRQNLQVDENIDKINKKYMGVNEDTQLYRVKAYEALLMDGVESSEAEDSVWGDVIKLNDSLLPRVTVYNGQSIEIDQEELQRKFNAFEGHIKANVTAYLSEGQLNRLKKEGLNPDRIETKWEGQRLVVGISNNSTVEVGRDKENVPISFPLGYFYKEPMFSYMSEGGNVSLSSTGVGMRYQPRQRNVNKDFVLNRPK